MRRLALVVLVTLSGALGSLVTATPIRAGVPAGEQKWAVVVGIDHFKGRTRPNVGAVGDANAFRRALLQAGWPEDHIMMVTDGQATASGIRSAFRWLADRSTDRSLSVFHYSGHTKLLGGDRDRDGEALDEYLWPHDNRFISDTELTSAMRAVRGLVWVDLSGCEAAGLDDGIADGRHLVTAASRESEKAYEDPDWRMSVFTGLLIHRAMLEGLADANGDRRVSVQEAFRYAASRAPEITAGQRFGAQHPHMAGGDGTEWFLDPPPPPPARPAPGSGGGKPAPTCIVGICVPTGR